jgi:mannose-6-phosphate isomerase-like protein (cupin superfamily)
MGSNAKVVHATSREDYLKEIYGVQYFDAGLNTVVTAKEDDLYYYQVFIGVHSVEVAQGDCVYFLSDDKKTAYLNRGPVTIQSSHVATVIRGYMPENKSSGITTKTNLPYVNGCSTKQIFSPDRLGDPTLQLLDIPPYSAEQAHHIHSTVRVAYIISGTGRSIVGMDEENVIEDLYPGKTVVLEKMCPHHFETDGKHLIVLPLHVFSSIGASELNHPMFNGTIMTGS